MRLVAPRGGWARARRRYRLSGAIYGVIERLVSPHGNRAGALRFIFRSLCALLRRQQLHAVL